MLPSGEHDPPHASRPAPTHQAREPFVPALLATLVAPLLWVLHFAFVYLLEGLLCTPMLPYAAVIPAAIVIATGFGAAACAWLMLASGTWLGLAVRHATLQSHPFLVAVQRVFAGLALVAIVWAGAGVLMLAPCSFAY